MAILKDNLLLRANLLQRANNLQVENQLIPGGIIPGVSGFELEDGSGVILLESGDVLLLEVQ